MNNNPIYVTKVSGERAPFNEDQLRRSLKRSNTDDELIEQVITKVNSELYDSISTKKIYDLAFKLLRKKSSQSASRYKLKRAILELGPTGFPFENFISELLKFKGYSTEVGTIVNGHCVNHEVDILADKESSYLIIECKFHSDQRRICDVKVPLYINSRFLDVATELKKKPQFKGKNFFGGLVTNTRFSSDALAYGTCMGMFMLGWDYPQGKSLKSLIDQSGLHPLTSLMTLTKYEKQQLLNKGIVLCKSLFGNEKILAEIQVSAQRIKKVLTEVEFLCEAKINKD